MDELQHLKDIDMFYDEYQGFKASQEKALGELHTSQESMAGQFSAFQEEYNKISQVQTESLAETKRLQEEAGKKIQYLSIGLGVNFVAVVVLLILLVSGVF